MAKVKRKQSASFRLDAENLEGGSEAPGVAEPQVDKSLDPGYIQGIKPYPLAAGLYVREKKASIRLSPWNVSFLFLCFFNVVIR